MFILLTVRFNAIAATVGLLVLAQFAFAGGTPENAVLIIDPSDAKSMYVGNYYKNARNIPDANVIYMNSAAPSYSAFISTNQAAFLGSLDQRRIRDHTDYVVLAPIGAFRLPVPPGLISSPSNGCTQSPVGNFSISTAYTLAQISNYFEIGGPFNELSLNGFGGSSGYPTNLPPIAFHAQTGYIGGSALIGDEIQHYFIGAMLGYTQGAVGNTVSSLLTMIDRSVAADGTRPSGVFNFMNNTNNIRNIRACAGETFVNCNQNSTPSNYSGTASSIVTLGGAAQVLSGVLPPNGSNNLLGVMTGFPQEDISASNLTFVRGAFADHLTSLGAKFDEPADGQTTVAAWIAAGASGSEGAVEEPCALVVKFPSSDFHKYYFQGMSLGESYLRSVKALPFQMMLYGDPLTRPFAFVPSVNVTSPPTGVRSGVVTITPSASTSKPGAAIANFDLIVDGIKIASASAGNPAMSFDTQKLTDGRHDIRILAYDNSAVQNVGRWIGSLDTSNYGHGATLSVSPMSVSLNQRFSFTYNATGGTVVEVRLMQNGRVVAASTSASGTLTVYGQMLGSGRSQVRLEASYSDGRFATSIPVAINVSSSGLPGGGAPVAYSYTKVLTANSPYLVELPASSAESPATITYSLINPPTKATLIQSGSSGPYRIIQALPGATGSEQLQFQVTTPNGQSNIATVTLLYTTVKTIAAPASSAGVARAFAGNNDQQGGVVQDGNNEFASLWRGTSGSLVNLGPSGGTGSQILGMGGDQQVGFVSTDRTFASLWRGSAASRVDLTPAGATSSNAQATDGYAQVGSATVNGKLRASLWSGSPNTWIDLSPVGASASEAFGKSAGRTVGYAIYSNISHAGMWMDTASSWVDLNPSGADSSVAIGVYGRQQVGYAYLSNAPHASLWADTAGTWIDLHPAGASTSVAVGTNGVEQVGYAVPLNDIYNPHASLWRGSAATWVDLSALLPPQYAGFPSFASSIYTDSTGTYVVGTATRPGAIDVIIWTIH